MLRLCKSSASLVSRGRRLRLPRANRYPSLPDSLNQREVAGSGSTQGRGVGSGRSLRRAWALLFGITISCAQPILAAHPNAELHPPEPRLALLFPGICQAVHDCVLRCAEHPIPTYDDCVRTCWDAALQFPNFAALSALERDLDPAQTDPEALAKAIAGINHIQQLRDSQAHPHDVLMALQEFFQGHWQAGPLRAWAVDLYFLTVVSDIFLSPDQATEHQGSLHDMLREIAEDGTSMEQASTIGRSAVLAVYSWLAPEGSFDVYSAIESYDLVDEVKLIEDIIRAGGCTTTSTRRDNAGFGG